MNQWVITLYLADREIYFNMGCGRLLDKFLSFLDCNHEMYKVELREPVIMQDKTGNKIKEDFLNRFHYWGIQ